MLEYLSTPLTLCLLARKRIIKKNVLFKPAGSAPLRSVSLHFGSLPLGLSYPPGRRLHGAHTATSWLPEPPPPPIHSIPCLCTGWIRTQPRFPTSAHLRDGKEAVGERDQSKNRVISKFSNIFRSRRARGCMT